MLELEMGQKAAGRKVPFFEPERASSFKVSARHQIPQRSRNQEK